MVVDVIIPAYNEQDSIPLVVNEIPKELVRNIVVVDNNSNDETFQRAESVGAIAVKETKQGYGNACLRGIEKIRSFAEKPDVVVFLDADYSDHPEEMKDILKPIEREGMDMVIGARRKKWREKGAMTPQQHFGNWLATRMIRVLYRVKYTDLGPFRAIRWDALEKIQMQDKTYGWTVEMQIKAIKYKLAFTEVPVHYRKRIGKSKISGTVKGTVLAGYKIIGTILKYR